MEKVDPSLAHLARYFKNTILELQQMAVFCELPYNILVLPDMKHKNWDKLKHLHLVSLESIGSDKK